MPASRALFARLWWSIPLLAAVFLVVVTIQRIGRLESRSAPTSASASVATGQLILPDNDQESLGWMLAATEARKTGALRLRTVTFDNAPFGRPTSQPDLYRWWLQGVAAFTASADAAPAVAIDRGARWADPLLQLLGLAVLTGLVAWRCGRVAAVAVALGWGLLYPLSGSFAPGVPHSLGLSLLLAALATLPLLIALGNESPRQPRAAAIAAGIAGGLLLSVAPTLGTPVLLGAALGGVLAARLPQPAANKNKKNADKITPAQAKVGPLFPWRLWAISGAVVTLLSWAWMTLPGPIEWKQLRIVHPLHALAWLGLGELLIAFCQPRTTARKSRWLRPFIAAGAVAALPVLALVWDGAGFMAQDLGANRLARLAGSPAADGTAAWLGRGGLTGAAIATLLPLLGLIVAVRGWWRDDAARILRQRLGFALGLVVATLAFAWFQLQGWALVDIGLILIAVARTTSPRQAPAPKLATWQWVVGAAMLLPGFLAALAAGNRGDPATPSPMETQALVERDLAQWLARRLGDDPSVVLAPPDTTTRLAYFGNLRGLGTPFWENREGFGAAVRMAGTHSQDEALALVDRRELTHIVMPTWDPYLEEYARLGATDPSASLIALLQRWLPPRWLRPVPYRLPRIAGFEDHAAVVFEVVEVQDDATALSRLAEYFVAMGDLRRAVAVAQALQGSFGTDAGGMIAQAHVAIAINNPNTFRQSMETLLPLLEDGRDRLLMWDQRVTLTLVLARAQLSELLDRNLVRTLDEADERDIRQLTPEKLSQWLDVAHSRGQELADPELAQLAQALIASATARGGES